MTNVKLSQIAPSPSNVAATTQFVAVEGGNTDYLFSPSQLVNGFQLARLNVVDQVLSGGWNVTSRAIATGSFTVDFGLGPLQYISNNGAFTINAAGSDGQTLLQVTNTSLAGLITFSGFVTGSNTGDALTTTNGSVFSILLWRANGISNYYVMAQQGGSYSAQPFISNISGPGGTFNIAPTTVGVAAGRGDTTRWSDVINVLDFGADPTNNLATAVQTTAAFQAAINSLGAQAAPGAGGFIGQAGKIYVPQGTYQLAPPVPGGPCLTLPTTSGNSKASIIIEGAGQATSLQCTCNGFLFDDVSLTASNTGSAFPWVVRNMLLRNSYSPNTIYKNSLVPSASWALADTTLQLTNTSINAAGGFNSNGGQILFTVSGGVLAANGVPCYVGYVTSITGLGANGTNATLTLGDVANATSGNKGGAQIPSSGTSDRLFANQGYYATTSWTATPTSATATQITMASSNPTDVNGGAGLAIGYYYVWDWTYVTRQSASAASPIPRCIGVVNITGTPTVPTGGWQGTTLTLTQGAQAASLTTGDLLMLSPIAGVIRHMSAFYGIIESCAITGLIGVSCNAHLLSNTINNTVIPIAMSIRNCNIGGPAANFNVAIGDMGVLLGQNNLVQNCDLDGRWIGARLQSNNPTIMDCRFEVCCYGIVLGGLAIGDPFGTNAGCTQPLIANSEFEGVFAAGILADTSALTGTLINLAVTTTHQNSCYGLFLGPSSSSSTIINCQFTGAPNTAFGSYWNPSFAGAGFPAAVYIATINPSNPRNAQLKTFITTTVTSSPGTYSLAHGYPSTAWNLPTAPNLAKFINCNNPLNIFTFSTLPGAQTGLSGYIYDGITSGVAGKILTITSGSFSPPAGFTGAALQAPVGSLITGAGVAANTIVTSSNINGVGTFQVNNSQAAGTSGSPIALTIYPIVDGDEEFISDCLVASDNTHIGTTVTVGGGSNHVKVRWISSVPGWVIV